MTVPAGAVTLHRKAFDLLKTWGWGPFLDLRSGWEKRGSGHKEPRVQDSIMIHHTGGTATSTAYLLNPTDRPSLVILANVHVDSGDRRIRLLAAGPTSHAGNGTKANYDKMRAGNAPYSGNMTPARTDGTFSANRYSTGVEVDGAGGPNEWDAWTRAAVAAVALAFQLAGGWAKDGKAPRVWAHKEFTYRKPGDPYADMGLLRKAVREALDAGIGITPGGNSPIPEGPKLGSRVLSRTGNDRGTDVTELITLLNTRGYKLVNDGLFGPAVEAAVRDYQTRMGLTSDGLAGPLTIAALKVETLPEPQPEDPAPRPEPPAPEPVDPDPAPDPEPPAPSPEQPAERQFRLLQLNTLAWRWRLAGGAAKGGQGLPDDSTDWPKFLAARNPSLMMLCEVSPQRRNTIAGSAAFKSWTSWSSGYVSVWWDKAKWRHTATDDATFDTPYHRVVRASLVDLGGSGLEIDVLSVHLLSNASYPAGWSDERKAAAKRADLEKGLKKTLRPGVGAWVGGDFNTGTYAQVLTKLGFTRGTADIPTTQDGSSKGTHADGVWYRSGTKVMCVVRGSSKVDPGKRSDHIGFLVNGTIRRRPTT